MKNKKGIAPILVIVGAVVVLGVVGYFLTNRRGGSGMMSGLNSGVGLNSKCDLNDSDLCKYVNRVTVGNYFENGVVMMTQTTDKDGQKSESVFEMDGKSNSKMITTQNGKEVMGLITLNNFTYMKDLTDNKWWKYENKSEDSTTTTQNPQDLKEQMKKYTEEYQDKMTYKKIGKEVCGSLSCFKYQMVMTDTPDYTQYVYFDDKQYLLRKTTTKDQNGSVSETTYEYKTVTIKEPSPVKEGNPWGGSTGQQSEQEEPMDSEQLRQIQEQIESQMQENSE